MISNFFETAAIITAFIAVTSLMVVMFYYLIKGAITGKCSSGLRMNTSQRWVNGIVATVPLVVIFLELAFITAPH